MQTQHCYNVCVFHRLSHSPRDLHPLNPPAALRVVSFPLRLICAFCHTLSDLPLLHHWHSVCRLLMSDVPPLAIAMM